MAEMIGNGLCHSFGGDGRLDILARSESTGDLYLVPHSGRFSGTGTYGEPVKIAENFHHLRNHYMVRTIDIDGSGRAHVLALSTLKYNPFEGVFLYPNKGLNGLDTLGEPIKISGRRADRRWETMAIGSLGGGPDVMFGREQDQGGVHAFFSQGEVVESETYDRTPHPMVTVDVADFPWTLADITRTGRPDLLVVRANGDLDAYEFGPGELTNGEAFTHEGTWHTIRRDWDAKVFAVTDVDLDGNPDLLALTEDGTLLAYVHSGKFDPDNPEATYAAEPEVVATGWQDFNSIS
nr:hypothetical protein GCM10017745_81530 [Saccharothrix mutabilis subsp. capreolus]